MAAVAPFQKRKSSKQMEDLEKLLDVTLTRTSSSRKASFADCVSAARNPRARSISARLVPQQISTCEEEAPRNYSSGGTRAAAAPAERSSRCDSTAQAQRAKIDSVDEDDGDDEITTLRQVIQHQEEDLRTAALIGQKILDTQEELAAELEAVREEKWLADCEKNELKRDLEYATRRCEQIQDDAAEAAPVEPQNDYDLWSPGAAPATDKDTSLPVTSSAMTGAATANEREVTQLRQQVERLQAENNSLKEGLMEVRLETNALRRNSVQWQERTLSLQTWSVDESNQSQLGVTGGSEASRQEGPRGRDAAGRHGQGRGDQQSVRSSDAEGEEPPASKTTNDDVVQESAPARQTQAGAKNDGSTLEDGKRAELVSAREFFQDRGCKSRVPRCQEETESNTKPPRAPESVATSERSFRRRSSGFEAEESQAELIEALRGQITQLRLEAQKRERPAASATRLGATRDGDNAQVRIDSRRSSDDDTGGARSQYSSLAYVRVTADDVAIGSCIDRAHNDSTTPLLRGRVRNLLAELATANRTIAKLRKRAQADQAAVIDLQRKVVLLHRMEQNNAMIAAPHVHGPASATPVNPRGNRNRNRSGGRGGGGGGGGGDGGSTSSDGVGGGDERKLDCLSQGRLCWLSWLWRRLMKRPNDGDERIREDGGKGYDERWEGGFEEDEAGGCDDLLLRDVDGSTSPESGGERKCL